jgi:hypothetical protein
LVFYFSTGLATAEFVTVLAKPRELFISWLDLRLREKLVGV